VGPLSAVDVAQRPPQTAGAAPFELVAKKVVETHRAVVQPRRKAPESGFLSYQLVVSGAKAW
jgi:hypothetical protein